MASTDALDDEGDPVPIGLVLDLNESWRLLEALEIARLALRRAGIEPGFQDELVTVIRMVHNRLNLDEGGVW